MTTVLSLVHSMNHICRSILLHLLSVAMPALTIVKDTNHSTLSWEKRSSAFVKTRAGGSWLSRLVYGLTTRFDPVILLVQPVAHSYSHSLHLGTHMAYS